MDSNQQAVDQSKAKLTQAIVHLQEDLKKLRTGRAHPSMLDSVTVEAYGTSIPLIQVGAVTAPEAQLLQITPFDPNNIQAIASAIRDDQSLGLNPMDDGRVVRVPIPALTEERRRDITKQVGTKLEDSMIRMRSIRHDAMGIIDNAKKSKSIGEDEAKRLSQQIDEAMNKSRLEAEAISRAKEHEIMSL